MTTTLTLTDDNISANGADGRKRIYATISLTNPYSTGGEVITTSTYFPNKPDGGVVTMINPSVSIDNTGIASTGTFRGTNTSTTSLLLQFFNAGLTATAKAGLFVDNTVANLSGTTIFVELIGR